MLFLLILGCGGVAFEWNRRRPRPDRGELLDGVALGLGLEFAASDDRDPASLPFELFGRGEQRRITNLMSGIVAARRTKIFDLADVVDATPRSLSCVVTELRDPLPALEVAPVAAVSRLSPSRTLPVVAAGDPSFDELFEVRADDPLAVTAVLTPEVRSFLRRCGADCAFEVAGRFATCVTDQLRPRDVVLVVEALCAFLDVVSAQATPDPVSVV